MADQINPETWESREQRFRDERIRYFFERWAPKDPRESAEFSAHFIRLVHENYAEASANYIRLISDLSSRIVTPFTFKPEEKPKP